MYFDATLWGLTAGARKRIAATVLIGLLAVAAGIARLALAGWLLATILQGAAPAQLALPAALLAAAMLARAVLEYCRAMLAHRTAARLQARLRRQLYDKVVSLGPAYFTQTRSGTVLLSLVEGVEQLEIYFGQYLPQLLVAALTPLLIFALVAFLDLPIALLLLAGALLVLVLPAFWHYKDRAASLHHREVYGAFASDFLDSLQGLATLKAFGQSGARARRLRERADALMRSTTRVMKINTAGRGITDAGIALTAAAAVSWGAYRVAEGQTSLAALVVILMLGVEVFRPLRELRALLHNGMIGMSAAQGILQLLDAKPALSAPDKPSFDTATLAPTITFDRVSFAYPGGRRPAHDGLSFEVAAGQRLAVVGPSGAGKSTVAKLLLRFYRPQRGAIHLGGRPLGEFTWEQLYGQLAVVSQDAYLFHGSVADNLRMGKPDASQAELEQAAREANAHRFITRLPQGYDTPVGERGLKLSGGQRQRLSIARALLRDAPVLILDEALSAVDAENEAQIQQALERLMRGRTTLIFAHRLSSVINADRILVLERGRVVESGRHAELMARGGVYHTLMAAQARGDDGIRAVPQPATAGADDGDRVAAAPTPLAEPPERRLGSAQTVAKLLALVKPYRGQLSLTFALGVARVIAFIGVGALSALVIYALKNGLPLAPYVVPLLALAPLAGLLHWLESWLAHDMAYRLLSDMRIALFNKLDALAPAYLLRQRSGDVLSVATRDVELVEYFFAHTVAPALVAFLVPLTVLAVLGYFSPWLALALLPFLAYAGLSPVLVRRRIDRLGERAWAAAGDLNAQAVDAVQGLAEIVVYRQTERRAAAFAAATEAFIRARMPFYADLARQASLQELAAGCGSLAVILVGAWLAAQPETPLDAALLPLLTLLAAAAFLPISEIAQVSRQLADTLAATRRIDRIHAEPLALRDGTWPEPPSDGSLHFSAVDFRYPDQLRPALQGVDLRLAAGTTTALVGPSGAGKSTLAHLLLRFWDPQHGTIEVDGRPLVAYRLDALRAGVALVAQDTYLFNDTLRANIALARPDAADAEIERAAEQAALGGFIADLPEGLDTRVGERGAQLSGGQRQRVAIARAFLKDAPLLILDEATSQLDAVSERAVRAALQALSQNRTTLVIAHRLSTVRDADHIVVLDHGRVVEQGNHAALLAAGGAYARLVAHQSALAKAV